MPHAATWNVSYLGACDILVHTHTRARARVCVCVCVCCTPKYAVLFLLQHIT